MTTENTTAGRLVLIACSKAKLGHAAPARELYRGDLFQKARAWAEQRGLRWAVLSALHGLVMPDQVIAPYEQTLVGASAEQRARWGQGIRAQLDQAGLLAQPLEILAGRSYRGAWCAGLDVATPLQGLGIGQQKAFLALQLRAASAEGRA